MLRSKTHETSVLLLGTRATSNFQARASVAQCGHAGGYEHVTELQDLGRPSGQVLRDLEKVRDREGYWGGDFAEEEADEGGEDDEDGEGGDDDGGEVSHDYKMLMNMVAKGGGGAAAAPAASAEDFGPPTDLSVPCDPLRGLIIAGDILYRRTNKKRYNRTIYLITDGCSPVTDAAGGGGELARTLEGLRALNVVLKVIGVGFDEEDVRGGPMSQVREESDEEEGEEEEGSDESEDDSEEEEEEQGEKLRLIKKENTKMLKSIAASMGGDVMAASDLISLMRIAGAKKIPRSAKKAVQLNLAPTLTVNAEYALMVSRSNLSTLRQHVAMFHPAPPAAQAAATSSSATSSSATSSSATSAGATPSRASPPSAKIHSSPFLTTADVMRDMSYRDASNPDVEVEHDMRARAYRYGSDYLPTNAYDEEALKMKGPVSLSVVGCVERSSIPFAALIDSGYSITGGASVRARTAISALAQALDSQQKVAIARFVKTVDADPLIGILLPFTFLPFAASETTAVQRQAADALVDSMMLGDDELRPASIPNPAIRSLNRTLIRRLVKGGAGGGGDDVVDCRRNGDVVVETPPAVLEGCREAVSAFFEVVPVKAHEKGGKSSTKQFWALPEETAS
ncbi:hypothetical protein TeGR_g12717 [Tetraparma gracilis]|uniref:Ku domain-containing protein n=1 Tax=Tetraparma gracilis TaxID=2962635 RepID=A0ABQ6MFI2_9STRA|nr:hypothetical protein TeGR_g12717 [Tetraparma gracilis]